MSKKAASSGSEPEPVEVISEESGPEAEEHLTHGGPYCAVPNCGRWAVAYGRCEHHKETTT